MISASMCRFLFRFICDEDETNLTEQAIECAAKPTHVLLHSIVDTIEFESHTTLCAS